MEGFFHMGRFVSRNIDYFAIVALVKENLAHSVHAT